MGYEFRIYQQLGELYIKQDRSKDAADTFVAFARRQPLHAQAPQMQARVIEIYERGGFANQALQAKKDYVSRYGIDSEFSRANPEGWDSRAAAGEDPPGRTGAPPPRRRRRPASPAPTMPRRCAGTASC